MPGMGRGRLGRLFGLPMPEFAIATVPPALLQYSAMADAADLGVGPVFASQLQEGGQEFTFSDVAKVEQKLQMEVLLFDWWVRNEDRTLTEYGGNPNLLWSAQSGGLRVFDLNLAFDDTFDEARFWQGHVFAGAVSSWPREFREEAAGRMERAAAELPRIWDELPVEWLYAEGDSNEEPVLSLESVRQVLNRFRENPEEFWAIRK